MGRSAWPSSFRRGVRPPGLDLIEAIERPGGEVLLRLARDEEAAASSDAHPDAHPEDPVEICFVTYPSAAGVTPLFRPDSGGGGGGRGGSRGGGWSGGGDDPSAKLEEWKKKPDYDWHTTILRDVISWRAWSADYAVERAFIEGGSWRDSARVNLSQVGRHLVVFAQWPEEQEVSLDRLRALLLRIKLLEKDVTEG